MDLNDTSITVWCPLVDADERNGSLHVVEGSHKIVPDVSGPWGNPFFRNFEKRATREILEGPFPAEQAKLWLSTIA